jgi:hypothetical protein
MNLARISHQVEITFWSTAVGVLSDRQTLRTLTLVTLAVFTLGILSIAFGVWVRYEPTGFIKKSSNMTTFAPEEPSPPRQHNTLVIVVDQVDFGGDLEKMHLQSVWLAVYLSSLPKINLAPIYPGGGNDHLFEQNHFQLGPDGAPTAEFNRIIQSMAVHWDHYMVIDTFAIQEMGDQIGWEEPLFVNVDEAQWPLTNQAAHAYELCHHIGGILSRGEADSMLENLAGHLSTNLGPNQVVNLWQDADPNHNRISCEFPTLEATRPSESIAGE